MHGHLCRPPNLPPAGPAVPPCPVQAGSHFNEDQHLEAGSKAVEFSKLAGSEEEASGSLKATVSAAAGSS